MGKIVDLDRVLRKDAEGEKLTPAEQQAVLDAKNGLGWLNGKRTLAHLNISKETLYLWRKEPGFPQPKKQGRSNYWDVGAIKEWMSAHGKGSRSKEAEGLEELRCEKLRKEIDLLAIKVEKERGLLVDRAEISSLLLNVASGQRALLYEVLVQELPDRLEGLDLVARRTELENTADRIVLGMKEAANKWSS